MSGMKIALSLQLHLRLRPQACTCTAPDRVCSTANVASCVSLNKSNSSLLFVRSLAVETSIFRLKVDGLTNGFMQDGILSLYYLRRTKKTPGIRKEGPEYALKSWIWSKISKVKQMREYPKPQRILASENQGIN